MSLNDKKGSQTASLYWEVRDRMVHTVTPLKVGSVCSLIVVISNSKTILHSCTEIRSIRKYVFIWTPVSGKLKRYDFRGFNLLKFSGSKTNLRRAGSRCFGILRKWLAIHCNQFCDSSLFWLVHCRTLILPGYCRKEKQFGFWFYSVHVSIQLPTKNVFIISVFFYSI